MRPLDLTATFFGISAIIQMVIGAPIIAGLDILASFLILILQVLMDILEELKKK